MTEPTGNGNNAPDDTAPIESALSSGERAASVVEEMLAAADVSRVYGEPIRHGDLLIIPAAEVVAIAGFGMGSGAGTGADARGQTRLGGGGGGGGGGRSFARTVAVIVVSPDGVRVEVLDVTKIALAALTAAGFVFASWRSLSAATKGRRARHR